MNTPPAANSLETPDKRSGLLGHVPVLNLANFTHGDAILRQRFVEDLRFAAHRVGFFYLRGYGGLPSQAEAVLQAARWFFSLTPEAKAAIHMVHSPHFRGYTAAGDEITRGAQDWREQIDIGAERAALPQGPDVPPWARLQGPNQWPDKLPAFKSIALGWQDTMTDASLHLLRALAIGLGQDPDRFTEPFHGTPVQHMKVIRYPSRRPGESRQGVGSHKDSGCITMVLQDERAGLQVLEDEDAEVPRWLDVPPLPGTVVVNLGEVLEILTDGYLRATTHRVVSPVSELARLSVAFFLSPRLEVSLPALQLPGEVSDARRGVSSDPDNRLLPHTGSNLLKGRLRSHPEVARRFYGDVLKAGC